MTQSADNDIERLLTMVETQAQDAAEILARKRVSLEGLIYLSNSVLLPSALYRLKLSHATCEQIDRVQSPVRRVLAKKAGLTSASTDVLYGGYMGCGWKRLRGSSMRLGRACVARSAVTSWATGKMRHWTVAKPHA